MQTESHPSDTSLKEPLKAHANSKISSMSEASPSLDASWMRKPTASYTWNVEVGILYSCQARLAVPATASCSEAMNMSAFSTFVSLWSLPRSQHGLHSCREPFAPAAAVAVAVAADAAEHMSMIFIAPLRFQNEEDR